MQTNEVFEHFSFIHPYYGDDKFQRIFFSKDLDYMLERQEQNVLLYKINRQNPKESILTPVVQKMGTISPPTVFSESCEKLDFLIKPTESREVSWTLVNRIKRFPLDLSECTFVNFLFSPDLMLYLDFNMSKDVFVIKRSLD